MNDFNEEFNKCRGGRMSEELGVHILEVARRTTDIMLPKRLHNDCFDIINSEVVEHLCVVYNIVRKWEVVSASALFVLSAKNFLRNITARRFSADRTQDCYGKPILIKNRRRVKFVDIENELKI
jgi:hypothetical protein